MLRQLIIAAALLSAPACQPTLTASDAASAANPTADDAFLDELAGDWLMDGQVMGEPVRYRAHGQRVLGGAWLEFHMTDANNTPPAYEARVFLSWDDEAHDYVAHWLDDFGAGGARVTATGARDGDTLTIHFPYADAAFRNIWVHSDEGWTLTVEAQQPDTTWRNFANYTIRRL